MYNMETFLFHNIWSHEDEKEKISDRIRIKSHLYIHYYLSIRHSRGKNKYLKTLKIYRHIFSLIPILNFILWKNLKQLCWGVTTRVSRHQ
jgi:hypothetical protein